MEHLPRLRRPICQKRSRQPFLHGELLRCARGRQPQGRVHRQNYDMVRRSRCHHPPTTPKVIELHPGTIQPGPKLYRPGTGLQHARTNGVHEHSSVGPRGDDIHRVLETEARAGREPVCTRAG